MDQTVFFFRINIHVKNRIERTQPAFTCSKLTTETGVVLVSLLLIRTYFTPCSHVSIVNFEHVIAGCVKMQLKLIIILLDF